MKKRFSVSPLSILLVILLSGVLYSSVALALIDLKKPSLPGGIEDFNAIICGDGELEDGEECDDGNTTSGDGCSSTCTIEECGNGTVDVGEECDDGNTTSGDGCSSTCENELGPDDYPPNGDVTPNFTGLIVSPYTAFLQYLNVEHDMYLFGKMNPNPSNGAVIVGSGNPDAAFDTGGNLYVYQFLQALDVLARRNVEAQSSVIAHNDLETYDDIYLRGASGDSGIIDATDDMVNIFDGLQVNGDIKLQGSAQRIGSYYTNYHTFQISGLMPTEGGYQVSCDTNDVLVSCSASLISVENGDRFLGTEIIDADTCSGRADDLAGDDDYLKVMAMCFDPNGTHSAGLTNVTGNIPTTWPET